MTTLPPIAFVDTEATDIGPRRLAWELAVIRREPGGARRELQTFIEIDLGDANPFALSVGGFYDRHPLGRWLAEGPSGFDVTNIRLPRASGPWRDVENYVTQAEAAALWCRWTHGAHVIGAVPNFDTEVMGAAARSVGLLSGHHYHLGDIENLITGWIRGRIQFDPTLSDDERARLAALAAPPWKSDDLLAEVGVTVPDEDRHTALGDARAVERAWDVMYGGPA